MVAGSASIGGLIELIEGSGLRNGVERSLIGPLNQAVGLRDDNLNRANDGAVCNTLASFVGGVASRLADGSLTDEQAEWRTSDADAIAQGPRLRVRAGHAGGALAHPETTRPVR